MSSLQSLDIALRSATTSQPPIARHQPEVAKLIDVSTCIGCKACQVACMQWNDLRDDVGTNAGTYDNPNDLSPESWTVMRFSEVDMKMPGTSAADEQTRLEWLIRKDGCMHCSDPGCLKACPAPGAIVKYSNGIVDFISENCIGCGNCVIGCPFDVPRISKKDDRAYKCSLCSDRVSVGLEPACVKACPTGALHFGSKEDMLDYGAERVADLKERGYDKAGIYDPPGVGGTHVVYVLQHADQPNLYHGLPENPKISPWVSLWKGAAKPLAVAAMVGTAIASFFHYAKVGPIETKEDDNPMPDRGEVPSSIANDRTVDPAFDPTKGGTMKTLLKRYDDGTRLNHWFVALLFMLAGLSGMALFHPSLFLLTGLFGGGQWDRTLHPFFGVLMVVGFAILFLQVWRENIWKPVDNQWLKHVGEMAGGNKSNMPPVGKYNAGQKLVFWAFGVSLVVLLITGFMFWRPWFAGFFPIPLRRVAVTLHAASAFVLVMSVFVHVYAAIWVKGTMQAMMRGTVTAAWAKQNHPLWHREKTGG